MRLRLPFALLALLLMAGPVLAQSVPDFTKVFSGAWQSYDAKLASGAGRCSFTLGTTPRPPALTASSTGCRSPFDKVGEWTIANGQLALLDAAGQTIILLGGSPQRISGETPAPDKTPIVIERAGGDGTAARLQGAYNISHCYFVGYSQTCAPPAELRSPALAGATGKIELEVNSAAYDQPRPDASTLGTVKQNSCIVINACVVGSDGAWCRFATPDGKEGWLRKMALRQNRWPIITFTDGCR
jgi:hypothetical protein